MEITKETQERIARIERHVDIVNNTVYPDDHEEIKLVILNALKDRIDTILHSAFGK